MACQQASGRSLVAWCPLQTTSHPFCSHLYRDTVVLGLADGEEDEDEPFGRVRVGNKGLATCLHLH